MKYYLPVVLILVIFWGCSGSKVYYEIPYELRNPENENEFINEFSKYLKDYSFFLDPGHGGIDRKNKGHQDLVVEADANLRVALALRDFLKTTGAKVILSRTEDNTVPLKERSKLANKSGADIFISIHHNAPAKENDNYTNYTSTYYHATKNDYEFEPFDWELARYVQRDLAYAMRNSGGPGSFDGTYSDYGLYPGEGLSVLRATEIPAILVECGFHTSQYEEKRLSIEEFNKIEAWGIFKGLCRFFAAGIPEIKFLNEDEVFYSEGLLIQFLLIDKKGIDASSIKVQIDSVLFNNYTFKKETNILEVPIKNIEPGNHSIRILVANVNEKHAFPFHKKFFVYTK